MPPPAQSSDYGSIFLILFVLMALLIAGFVAVTIIRKRMRDDEIATGPGFSLSDLRDLHREGKLSTEEFEKAKNAIVEAARVQAARDAEAKANLGATARSKGFPVSTKPDYLRHPPTDSSGHAE